MEQRIKSKCRAVYAQLYRNIGNIRKYLDHQSAEKLIHALVHSHIDYCNALLIGLPKYLIKKLQMVQSTAAIMLHITPTLKPLHWSPVEFRIKYKMCLLTFNAPNGRGPQYLSEMFTTRKVHFGLRTHEALTLNIPRTRTENSRGSDINIPRTRTENSRGSDIQYTTDKD